MSFDKTPPIVLPVLATDSLESSQTVSTEQTGQSELSGRTNGRDLMSIGNGIGYRHTELVTGVLVVNSGHVKLRNEHGYSFIEESFNR
jgi:hypothetical protein